MINCNSYPKSGTHLLYQILYSLPGTERWNDLRLLKNFPTLHIAFQEYCCLSIEPEQLRNVYQLRLSDIRILYSI